MKIQVLLRASNQLVEIDESDFDEELHLRIAESEKKKTDSVGDMSPEEFAKGIGAAVGAGVRGALEELGVGKPDDKKTQKRIVADPNKKEDEPVNRFSDRTLAYGRAARTFPGWEARYARLSDAERAVRSPEGDVHTWRYMKAVVEKDIGTLRELSEHDKTRFADLDLNDPFIRATMGTTSTAVGGALVPSPLADLIVLKRDAKERLLSRSMQLTTEAETLSIPQELAVGAVAGVAENVAIGETDSTLAEIVLTKKKVGRLARSSRELLSSISGAFSLSEILSNQAARKIGVFMDLQGAQDGDGVGTNHTNAIAEASIATVTVVTGALTRDKLVALILGLPTEWRDGAELTLMGNSTLTGFISALEDTTGRPLYQGTDQATRPMSDVGNAQNVVEGIPYIELPFTADLLWVGSLREGFAILNGGGMRVEVTDIGAGAFASDQVVWKFVERRDSGVVQADAFREAFGAITAPA